MIALDASMTLRWLFVDEATPTSDAVFDRVGRQGAVAPELWPLEIANTLRSAVRRGRCSPEDADRSINVLLRLRVEIDDQTSARAWGPIRLLSEAHNLSVYDAAYLELAMRRGLPLASCDRQLVAAAERLGLEVLTA